jgi:AraC-like DNA-binding protein
MVAEAGHSFPAAHALQLVTLVQRWGIGADELLAPLGLSEPELSAPHARISAETLRVLTARARTLTGEPGLGFYLGLQKRLSMYGYLGFAGMNAATVREALELTVRYSPAITTGLHLALQVEGELATIRIEELVDLGDVHDVAVFSLLVGMLHMSAVQTGREAYRASVDLPFPKPDYFDRFAHLLPGARFDQPSLCIRFPARGLDVPLKTPDRAALELAREACERELRELGGALSLRVRKLVREARAVPTIEAVARALSISTRTLKRRLAAEGLTYTALIDGERRERALQLLRATELPLEQIAEQLDYSSLPNFARAFRRWTGMTPAQYRKQRG